MSRSLIDITALDLRIQQQIAEYGNLKEFRITVWRQARDGGGCNWNARVDRVSGGASNDAGWWDVVPNLREPYNLR